MHFKIKQSRYNKIRANNVCALGVETVVIGMAHRGRLNTLVNICSKPLSQLLVQFNPIPLEGFGSGDVKYHLGTFVQKLLERLISCSTNS